MARLAEKLTFIIGVCFEGIPMGASVVIRAHTLEDALAQMAPLRRGEEFVVHYSN